MRPLHRTVLWLSAASVLVTLPHSFEDFDYAIYERFGVGLLPAAFGLAVAYAAQLVAAVFAWQGRRAAILVNAALALVWLAGAVLDHLPDVVAAEPYRAGFVSKALELGVMVVAAAWLGASLLALREGRRWG